MAAGREPTNAELEVLNFVENGSAQTPSTGHNLHVDTGGILSLINTSGVKSAVGGDLSAVVMQQTATAGTNGGSMATVETWITRNLNASQGDTALISLSSGAFTPVAGTYIVFGWATGYQIIRNVLRLHNTTQDTVAINGTSEYFGWGHPVTAKAFVMGVITVNGTDAFELQHMSTDDYGTNSQGAAVNDVLDGANEVYASVLLVKIG